MTDETSIAETYMAEVEALMLRDTRLSPLAAGVLVAIKLDIAHDSRSFAKALGINHALALREVEILTSDYGLLEVTERNRRTQRTFYCLSVTGKAQWTA